MTLKVFPWLLSVVLALILGLQLWMASDNWDRRKSDNSRFQAKLDSTQHRISQREDKIEDLEAELADDAKTHAEEQKRLTLQLSQVKGREVQGRPKIVLIAPEAAGHFQKVDSAYASYDSLLKDKQIELDTTRAKRGLQAFLLRENVKDLKEEVSDLDSVKTVHFNEKGPSPLVFSISAGYGLMSTYGEIRSGVFFGPSVGYRLPMEKISLRKLFRRKR